MKYIIYQLNTDNINVIGDHKLFESWDILNKTAGFSMWDYKKVYEGEIDEDENTAHLLDVIFRIFNLNHPEDFRGHSLSVSDVVELNGVKYYCDNYGWVDINNGKEL